MSFFASLLRYARFQRGVVIAALALLTLASLLSVGSAKFLGDFVQKGLAARDLGQAYRLGTSVVFLELLAVAALYFGRRLLADAAIHTILKIRYELFAHLGQLPMSYFDRQALGRTVTRLTYDVDGIEDFFSGTLARLLSALLALVTILGAMLIASPKLGFSLMLALIPALIATVAYRRPLRKWNREFAKRNSTINAKLSEFLNGISVIRAFGAEDWSKRRFDAVVDEYLESAVKVNVLNSWSRPVTLILCQIPLLLLLWFGSQQVSAGILSLGLFVTFIRFCERLSRPVAALAQEIHTIQAAFASAERVSTFLAQPTEVAELGPNGTYISGPVRGEVEFVNLSMAYQKDRPVLKNISFHVQPGECIGLAGATGSGKTSTLALLARLYEFQSGEIRLDGRDLRSFERSGLRAQLGYVSQDAVIFKGTLRENLAFGNILSDEEIRQACEKTGLQGCLQQANMTLDSELLDHGSNLSVGERQLLSLTRVLIKDPGILILDEATANIDPQIEALVYRAIQKVMSGRTAFIIAHRLRTLNGCDRIFLFKEGQLVESGHPRDLLAQSDGYYSQLYAQSPDMGTIG